jgi:hypothetical protein
VGRRERRQYGHDASRRRRVCQPGAAGRGDRALGIVDFSIFPHLDHDQMPQNSMANAEKWASRIGSAAYAIDDQTAIKVVDGTAEIVSEGRWRFFPPNSESAA